MSYFKYLSDDPDDYEDKNDLPAVPDLSDPSIDSFHMQNAKIDDYIELNLDTGEKFIIPINWLINISRYLKFGPNQASSIH
jgi:hypothetical protein